MRHFSVSCKTVCIKCHIRYRFQLQEGLVFPFCPSPTVHSGNHAIHSAPPPSVLSLAKLHRFFCSRYYVSFPHFPAPLNIANIATLAKLIFIAYSLFLRNFATHSSHRPYSAQGRDELELSVSLPHSLGLDLFFFYKACMCPLNGAFAASCFVHYQLFQIHTSHRSLLFQKGHDGLLGILL